MPADMSRYPDNWQEIRNRILRRAGGNADDPRIGARCEVCGVENYTMGYRAPDGELWTDEMIRRSDGDHPFFGDYESQKLIKIVLTIAHLDDPDPMNCSDDNLKAMCQKCHNSYDVDYRKKNRAITRRSKIIKSGQPALL